MYDVKITETGALDLSSGDLAKTTLSETIDQKLYVCMVDMPSNFISGLPGLAYENTDTMLRAYITRYFTGDTLVNPAKVTSNVTYNPATQLLSVSLSYSDRSPDGANIEASSGLKYQIKDGTAPRIVADSDALSARRSEETIDITIPITVADYTTELELPVLPATDIYGELGTPFIMLFADGTAVDDTAVSYRFSIPTVARKRVYAIGNYIDGFPYESAVIISCDVEAATVSYQLNIDDGFTIEAESVGQITGTVSAILCTAVATSYQMKDTVVQEPVFQLHPSRGRYMAQFPRTISPGRYVLKYKGIK